MQNTILVDLPTGTLHLRLEHSDSTYTELMDFAARANPKRAFLFLSKVLGKHYPSRPSAMAGVHQRLAASVPHSHAPVVFIGMAETATGLGQGVFEAWIRAHPGQAALYLQTTRYRIQGAKCLLFEESHSHAPRLFLHLPPRAETMALLQAARQVVLMDDELSTGNTFINLVERLRAVMPVLTQVHLATIADFTGRECRAVLAERMGCACSIGALLRGAWRFAYRPSDSLASFCVPSAAQCAVGAEVWLDDTGYGRLGRDACVSLPRALVERLAGESIEGGTLVLGTGEFMHTAFVLGQALEACGVDVRVQSTTRSPILKWGAVRHILPVPDPYGEDIPNFIYNVHPGQYARVLICHETPPNAHLRQLAQRLQARLIHFQAHDEAEEIPV
ncbi:phosphoribosyltransferase domain-containing protein [Thiorhodospira sibirica]|uniref:phosphoribosyltransferase domain-containing protein n=1 Tax=Thiorhodospira sibirica TaxID=154347 RepID=UPI00022C1D46|nr:phosphoribosyltransferase domain-containing protein [Thiorhodospira sibirica]